MYLVQLYYYYPKKIHTSENLQKSHIRNDRIEKESWKFTFPNTKWMAGKISYQSNIKSYQLKTIHNNKCFQNPTRREQSQVPYLPRTPLLHSHPPLDHNPNPCFQRHPPQTKSLTTRLFSGTKEQKKTTFPNTLCMKEPNFLRSKERKLKLVLKRGYPRKPYSLMGWRQKKRREWLLSQVREVGGNCIFLRHQGPKGNGGNQGKIKLQSKAKKTLVMGLTFLHFFYFLIPFSDESISYLYIFFYESMFAWNWTFLLASLLPLLSLSLIIFLSFPSMHQSHPTIDVG